MVNTTQRIGMRLFLTIPTSLPTTENPFRNRN
jgi:hypothetical protein